TAQIIGTSWKFPQARQWPVALGTFFGPEDEEQFEAVAVLGRTTADDLFPDEDPLGQYVLVGNQSFQVIGVMSRKGAAPNGQDQDEVVLVPYMTSQVRLSGNRYLNRATVAVADVDRIKQTTADIESLLAGRHGTVDFRIMNAGMFLESEVASRETMTKLLGSIAAISLLVGGIGVMNIMLVSVTERTREIGIRMATGARTRNILQQFLIEALVVSSVGGLIGVIMGFTATFIVAGTTSTTVAYSVFPVVLAFGSAFATGLIFGFLPARKAAYLDPVVALQSE
ncbi:MAG TPA: ABC transporter permease, partial [Steroidobacteraceae bacterium]|nr:ABC transporter permease [Steroidobacteraceae bacterium]